MRDFLSSYYREIVVILWFLIELVFSIVLVVKKQKKQPSVFSVIMQLLPSWIRRAEDHYGPGNGELKKAAVISLAKEILKKYGCDNDACLICRVDELIEDILSTPEKKEVL